MPMNAQPPGDDDSRSDEDWEDILFLRVESDATEEVPRRPVRLSSLRPPGQEQIPTDPLPLRPGQRWDPAEMSFPEIRDLPGEREKEASRRLSASEHARRAAEARVAELERQLADVRAQIAHEREAARRAVSGGPGTADLAKLSAELAGAREIISAMEEAYLAGEHFSRGGPLE